MIERRVISQSSSELERRTSYSPTFNSFFLLLLADPISYLNADDVFEADVVIDVDTMETLQAVAKLAFAQVRLYEWGAETLLAIALLYMQTLPRSPDIPDWIRVDMPFAERDFEIQVQEDLTAEVQLVQRLIEQIMERWLIQLRRYPFEPTAEFLRPKTESTESENKNNPLEILYRLPDWLEHS